jgi:hypothetical protein
MEGFVVAGWVSLLQECFNSSPMEIPWHLYAVYIAVIMCGQCKEHTLSTDHNCVYLVDQPN